MIPEKEKPRFETQEAVGADAFLKKVLFLFLCIFIWIDPLVFNYIPIPGYNKFDRFSPALLVTLPSIVLVLYSVTNIDYLYKRFHLNTKKSHFINCIATICYGVHVIIQQSLCLGDALQTGENNDWIETYISLSYSIFIVVLFILLTPNKHLKAFVGMCYHIGIAIGYIRAGYPDLIWVILRTVISSFYFLALMWLKDKFRWRLYIKSLESEAWNNIHKDILDRNPSLIAVLDYAGKVIYSNDIFQGVSRKYGNELFKQITQLKKRTILATFPTEENAFLINEIKNTVGCEENGPESPLNRLKTQDISSFENLELLLDHYRLLFKREDIFKEDQIVFEGKISKTSHQNTTLTFEIVIRYLAQYQKTVLIINNTTLRDMLLTSESVNEYKDKILASISHELRTPLHGNLCYLQAALSDKNIPIQIKDKLLLPALRSGKLLVHLINDILDYSQLQTNKIILHHESRPLKETLQYCFYLFQQAFETKNIKLTMTIDHKIPNILTTDHDRLIQVVLNLLSNALKFTMKGIVSLEAHSVDCDVIQIKVVDSGVGIPVENIQGLFEEKTSSEDLYAEGRRQKNSMGVGLGLKISYKLAKELSFSKEGLRVESSNGKGSVFSFLVLNKKDMLIREDDSLELERYDMKERKGDQSLPDIPEEYEESPGIIEIQSEKALPNLKLLEMQSYHCPTQGDVIQGKEKRILVVDDEPFNILALRSLLSQFNLTVISACNGQEALEKIADKSEGPYNLILIDCQMPIMDGYEATEILIKKMEAGEVPNIPIIGCTAFSAKEKLDKCLQCGMKEVVTKPLMKDKIKQIIRKYLE